MLKLRMLSFKQRIFGPSSKQEFWGWNIGPGPFGPNFWPGPLGPFQAQLARALWAQCWAWPFWALLGPRPFRPNFESNVGRFGSTLGFNFLGLGLFFPLVSVCFPFFHYCCPLFEGMTSNREVWEPGYSSARSKKQIVCMKLC